ncbi:DsbA family protein [Sphingomonas glaciei]|uniref:DsbA family protein n=1 Tax=Sphingomonas glaciei TaxID=2938948 RepID=A0ABY5MTE4_9SPHN|nr:DsbA family protein [Sphingomonas glaciei]UUR07783.1 DsbA family protein [Sphingomonas glaciei]
MSEGKGMSGWGALLAGGAGGAVAAVALGFAALQAGWADRLIRDSLVANPTVLVETADALRDSQYAPVLTANRAALETPFGSSWQGADAKTADVTLVEFYDYACGYCKASLPVIARLVKEDPKLRVVYREFPILGPDSEAAARMALGASKSGKFMAFHDALYAAGRPSEATLIKAATDAGVPAAVPNSPELDAELRKNFQLAQQLGATGTPLFIVGNKVMNGAVGYDALKKAIADARAKG